ncbi:MAG TPA: hypothetical protein VF550_01530 [Polyangia bacterium]
MRKLLLIGILALTTMGSVGCAYYGGVAVTPDGTIYVAKNDGLLFGLLRQVYACKPAGATLTCNPAGNP